jgi:CDP-4-dehydro-6-deoxyglucose reductase
MHLSEDIVLLHLQTPRSNRLRFLAGQSVALDIAGGLHSELPIASCPCDDRNIQFHVRRNIENDFCVHVFNQIKPGDVVTLTGPSGEFIFHDDTTRPVIFLAVETGFAPIKSLVEHAMSLESVESMHLYWLGQNDTDRYLSNLCRSWADALDEFHFTPLDLTGGARAGAATREALAAGLRPLLASHKPLTGVDVYLAAPAASIATLTSLLSDAGLPTGQLYTVGVAS